MQSVRELQEYLRRVAWADDRIPLVGVDGIFGEETAQAVRNFQRAYGLPATGTVDKVTWQALREVERAVREYHERGEGVTVLQNGQQQLGADSDAAQIYVLQAVLQQLYLQGDLQTPVPINGVYGEQTVRAVRQIRALGALPPQDTVDRETWNVIAALYNGRR